MRDKRFHVLHLMHNTHTVGERRWNSNLSGAYGPLLDSIRHLDGLVTLTRRQRDDVAERYGATNNLFVVPNPVELPELPALMPERDRATFAIVSRLESQKRLDLAIRAWALVMERRPEAKLLIYGDGGLRLPLETLIAELGVGEGVKLMGHDPRAKEQLLTATAFVMTSGYEGYPLAPLESMSFGCPVISYDIKYGPREQISEGVDGFLVAAGDNEAIADRVVQLIDDPELVRKLSEGALRKAEQHDYNAFLRDWRTALEAAVGNKAGRVRLKPTLVVDRIGWAPARRLPGRLGRLRASSGAFRDSRQIELEATLHLEGKWHKGALADCTFTLDAVSDASGVVTSLPVSATQKGRSFDLTSSFDLAKAFTGTPETDHGMRLRLRLVLNNWAWETTLSRPDGLRPNFEVSFDDRGQLHLLRGTTDPTPTS